MAPRVILDSEDDGSDFGEEAGLGDIELQDAAETEMPRDEPLESVSASHDFSTESTDPSFFQQVYNQQQGAADLQSTIPDTAPSGPAVSTWTDVSSAPPHGQKPQSKEYSSLTSVTDPTPASRRPKRTRQGFQEDVVDLTNITTPNKDAASGTSDVWDVPTSTRSQRATRTYGKRKSAQLSLEQESAPDTLSDTQDPYAFPDATPPTRSSKRRAPSSSAQQPPDSSPVMLVPMGGIPSSDRRTRSSRKKKGSVAVESSLPDTAVPSLYVTQSTLTASQKQEFRVVSLLSEAVPEASDTELPGLPLGVGEPYKSSGATTIAYPTPSRIGSLRRLPDVVEEVDGYVETTSPGQGVIYQSSPDVLNDMTTATSSSRPKRSRTKIVSSAGLSPAEIEPPPSTRRTKKRKAVQDVDDDTLEHDPLGGTQGNDEMLQQITLGEGVTGDSHIAPQPEMDPAPVAEVEPMDVEIVEVPATTPKAAPKGKRGRKKKGSKADEPNPEPTEPAPTEAEPERAALPADAPEPPAKRKRGRPRKSDVTKPQAEPEHEQELQQQPEAAQAEAETDPSFQALSEIHHNSQPGPATSARDEDESDTGPGSKENGASAIEKIGDDDIKPKQKDDKQPVKDAKAGSLKVQYRVGLSKRSRIAPLLKSLKKPV